MIKNTMGVGPHNQRMAQLSKRFTSEQMLERIRNKEQNPLVHLISKFKKQLASYQTQEIYPQSLIGKKIESIDKLLTYNGKLAPLLSSLERQNNTLRNQLSLLSSELSKTLSICEQLINENKEQKSIIINKNEDIKKVIETIALNQSQMKGQLEYQIYLLEQQNSILLKHMQEIKKQKQKWKQAISEFEDEVSLWKNKQSENNIHLLEAIQREQQLARKLSLMEQNYFVLSEDFDNIKKEKQDLVIQFNSVKNELLHFKESPHQNSDKIKENFEEQIRSIIQQYEQLKKQRSQIVRQTQKYKHQNQKLKDRFNEIQKQYRKIESNYELTNSLLNQFKNKNSNLLSNITRLQSKNHQIKKENEDLRNRLDSLSNINSAKQKIQDKQIDTLRKRIEEMTYNDQKRVNDMKKRENERLEAKELEIEKLTEQNYQLRKRIEKNDRK